MDLAFDAEILSAADPNHTIANVTPGKGNVVAQVRFVNGVTKWAIFDAKRERKRYSSVNPARESPCDQTSKDRIFREINESYFSLDPTKPTITSGW